jgi:hypothetical protein
MKHFKFLSDNDNTISRFIPPGLNVPIHNTDPIVPIQYEPMRRNRFVVNFPDQMEIPTYLIREIERPRLVVESIDVGNGYMIPGQHRYEPIIVKFVEMIGQNITNKLIHHFVNLTRFDLYIEMIDPTGVTVETWSLMGCVIIDLNGDLLTNNDYDMANLYLRVQPNYFTIH